MGMRNSAEHYGALTKLLHWLMAVWVLGLLLLGLWMVELDYYHAWYKAAPQIHKSLGLLLVIVYLLRIAWKLINPKVQALASHSIWEVRLARLTHLGLYLLPLLLFISGYLISTADGRGVEVFNWFEVASLGELVDNQEDIAGKIHQWLAYGLIGLVVLHGLGALKHHVIDKDSTLKRMF